jgi:hypothetical protein
MPTTGQPVPPDAEIIFRDFLLSKTGITNLVGTRIATNLPRDAEMPFLVFVRAGGTLVRPSSQVHLQSAVMPCIAFSGEWGGDGTKSTPDYSGAMNLANAVIKECFNAENEYVETNTSNTRAKIYGFDIVQMPSRMNEVTTGLGRYDFGIAMVYRAV